MVEIIDIDVRIMVIVERWIVIKKIETTVGSDGIGDKSGYV